MFASHFIFLSACTLFASVQASAFKCNFSAHFCTNFSHQNRVGEWNKNWTFNQKTRNNFCTQKKANKQTEVCCSYVNSLEITAIHANWLIYINAHYAASDNLDIFFLQISLYLLLQGMKNAVRWKRVSLEQLLNYERIEHTVCFFVSCSLLLRIIHHSSTFEFESVELILSLQFVCQVKIFNLSRMFF